MLCLRLMKRPVVDFPFTDMGESKRQFLIAQPPQRLFMVILNESEEQALGLVQRPPIEETEVDRWLREWQESEARSLLLLLVVVLVVPNAASSFWPHRATTSPSRRSLSSFLHSRKKQLYVPSAFDGTWLARARLRELVVHRKKSTAFRKRRTRWSHRLFLLPLAPIFCRRLDLQASQKW